MAKDFGLWDLDGFTIEDPSIDEAKVGNVAVLGKVKGPHFVPDGKSRNGRYYEKKLWDNTLKDTDFNERLSRNLLFGTIGHAPDWDAEKFLREGLVSHITSEVWIDEKSGLGNATDLILDTPAGRALNTYLRAGSKPFSSSRAFGKLGTRRVDGVPVVDPKGYRLEGFDFVLSPGFLEADPKLESLVESLHSNKVIYDIENIDESSRSVDIKSKIMGVRTTEGDTHKDGGKESMDSKEMIEQLTTEKLALEKSLGEVLGQLNKYKEIGTIDEILEFKETSSSLSDLGTIDEVTTALEEGTKMVSGYKELGTPEEIQKMVESYKSLGTPEDISEAFDKAETIVNELKKYQELGTPDEIGEALDRALEMAKEAHKKKETESVKDLSATYEIPEEAVREMVETMKDIEKVETTLKKIQEGSQYKSTKKMDKKKEVKESSNSTFDTLINNR